MNVRHGIVVVAENRDVRRTLGAWFGAAGYAVAVAATFAEAKDLLSLGPDLIVAELKLGEYNGLHVASCAHNLGVPAIVIGPQDVGHESDAQQLGARYLSSACKQDLLDVVGQELSVHHPDARDEPADRFFPMRRRLLPLTLPNRSLLAN